MKPIIAVTLSALAVVVTLAAPVSAKSGRIEVRHTDAQGHLRSGSVKDVASLSAGCFPRSQVKESGHAIRVNVELGGGQSGLLIYYPDAASPYFVAETDFLAPDSACAPSPEFVEAIDHGRLVSTSRAPVWVAAAIGIGLLLMILFVALGGLGVGPMPNIELSDSAH